jgi:lipopolysaccharide export system protein LptC
MGRIARLLFALIVLIASSCGHRKKAPSSSASASNDPRQNNLTMYDLHVQSYVDTKLSWDVTAPLGEVFTASNVMRLTHMKSEFYEDGQRSGQVQSELALMATGPAPKPIDGVTLAGENDVYLSSDVVMVSTDGTKVLTDWARYSRKNDLITSTAPVKVVRQDSITNGVGMEARPDMSDLKIFHQTLLIPGDEKSE